MSLNTWINEFARPTLGKKPTRLQMIDWSLKKWRGLTRINLRWHGVCTVRGDVCYGDNTYHIGDHCPLCPRYRVKRKQYPPCFYCPVAIVRGWTPCDKPRPIEDLSPWHRFAEDNEIRQMLLWLRKARRMLMAEAAKRQHKLEAPA